MFNVTNLALRQSSELLFSDATFRIHAGQRVGVTGVNGAGKSSLFSMIRGELPVDEGSFDIPSQWTVAEVRQEFEITDQSAIEYVIDGDAELRRVESELQQAEAEQSAGGIASCHERLQQIDGYQAKARAARLMAGLGFTTADGDRSISEFSGGWVMRLNLARALMCRSDLLLLDEPTNHLDLDAVIWLERWLKQYQGTLLLISHDRDFLDAVVERVLHIEQRKIRLYTGNYSAFEVQRAENLAQQQASYEKQQQVINHMQSFITRFKAKATKAKQAQSRIKALEKMQLISPAHVDSPFNFHFKAPKSLPSSLLNLQQASVGYGEQVILSRLNFSLIPGERIGLLGLNGAGKSTFIKLLAGELKTMAGDMVQAKELRVGYFAQHQLQQLDQEAPPLLIMQRLAPELSEREARTYLGGFDFRDDKVKQTVASFSGGEKARLVLALIIWQQPNLLLLDEPTNHLDLEMRLALNQALQEFEGSVILVSHDRYLLRSVCDDLWLVDRGQLARFDQDVDGYPAWLESRRSGKPAKVAETIRIKPAIDRKQLKAMQSRLKRLERDMEKLQTRLQELESSLAENDLYQPENRDKLDDINWQRAQVTQHLQQVEEEWLTLGEELEN